MYIEEKNINQTVLPKRKNRPDVETVIELFFSVIFFYLIYIWGFSMDIHDTDFFSLDWLELNPV